MWLSRIKSVLSLCSRTWILLESWVRELLDVQTNGA
jgi:hypothetical protein